MVRKLLILARESGYRLEKEDIRVVSLLPAEYFQGRDEFWEKIPTLDASFEKKKDPGCRPQKMALCSQL